MIKSALVSTLLLISLVANVAAGPTATVDVTTLTPPAGWKRVAGEHGDEYTATNQKAGSVASVLIMRSIANGGDPRANFDKAWANFVTATLPDAPPPTLAPSAELDGWQLVQGTTTYTYKGRAGRTTIITATRSGTFVVILATTIGALYLKDVEKVFTTLHFAAPAGVPAMPAAPATHATPMTPATPASGSQQLAGAWGFSTGGRMGSTQYSAWLSDRREYVFDGKGSYTFLRRINVDQEAETSIIRERGTYRVDGDVLALTPTNSERELWSKVRSGPNSGAYDKLVRRERVALEKTTYRVAYTRYLDTQVPNLMLTPSAPTQRDGTYNATTQYRLFHPDASYYTAIPPTP